MKKNNGVAFCRAGARNLKNTRARTKSSLSGAVFGFFSLDLRVDFVDGKNSVLSCGVFSLVGNVLRCKPAFRVPK